MDSSQNWIEPVLEFISERWDEIEATIGIERMVYLGIGVFLVYLILKYRRASK